VPGGPGVITTIPDEGAMTPPRRSGAAGHANARAAVIDVLRAADTISRTEIGAATGLTPATVSGEVRRLIDDGIVAEVGRAPSNGGTPRRLLRLVPGSRFAVGVHLDHDGVTYALADLGGDVVARRRVPGVGTSAPEDVVAGIAAQVRDLVREAGVDPVAVLGLGVASPGPLTASGLVMSRPALHRWVDYPLVDRLSTVSGLPVVVDNDATAAAVGEHWVGGAVGSAAVCALYMATGIGSGTVVDGVPYRGASSNAGEIGHVCVDLTGPECWCGARGCVEAVAGPAAVVAAARARGVDLGPTGRPATEDFATLARAALRGDAVASSLLTFSAQYMAVAAQTLATVMDLDQIVLTGPAFGEAGSLYLPVVAEHLQRTFFARGSHELQVRISGSAHEAAAIGAAALVLQSELAPRPSAVRMPSERTAVAGSLAVDG
jgi:predicted NBD/HSP70 family sugar kinase